jgi:hypothetical protein
MFRKNNELERNHGNLSMNIGVEQRTEAMKSVDDSNKMQQSSNYFSASRLDLNSGGDHNEGATNCKQLDLNRFSWN